MTTYIYNGKILIKNSKRDNYRFACIHKEDGWHLQISSTREGADKERNRRISECRECLANYRNALKTVEEGKDFYDWKDGRHSGRSRVDHYKKDCWNEEDRKLDPKSYYTKCIAETEKRMNGWINNFEIVEVEKR